MVKLITTLLLLLLATANVFAQQSKVHLSTDNQQVYIGDAIIIDIESTGLIESLNVEPLKKIATFDRETYGTRIAVVGGKVVENKIRRMEFTAVEPGIIIFGPLTGVANSGEVQSNSIAISVSKADDEQWSPSNKDLTLEFTLDNHSPYVHQKIIADMVLRHRYPVADESISLPDFSQFDVVPVFEQRRTLDSSDEGWRVISWQWLLHPKSSGELTVQGPGWSGLMVKSRTQRGNFTLAPQPIDLSIQAANNPDEWWLPASSVVLEDSWSSPVTEISAGDELIRTVTITATGILSQQIPDILPLESRAISSVLISQQRNQTLVDNIITSNAEFKFRMTAQSPIPVFLDTIRVPWWSTVENKMKEAIIPARRINVGLPERADVLANLALKRTPWERIKLTLRSINVGWKIPALLTALLITTLLLLKKSTYVSNLIKHASQRRHIRKINRAVRNEDWFEVWTLLEAAPATVRNNIEAQKIQAHVEHALFSQSQSTPNTGTELPILRMKHSEQTTEYPRVHLPQLDI